MAALRSSGVLLLALIGAVSCQVLRTTCNSQSTCADCIRANPDCVWCSAANFTSAPRCYPNDDTSQSCESADLQNPQAQVISMSDEMFTSTIQLIPSFTNVQVRPQQLSTFNVQVRPARNFPIDLYLLMDLSYSMMDDLMNLQGLASTLAARIQVLSTNFRIGFGSFVEKRLGPYTTMIEGLRNNPCLGAATPCQPTYSYRHVLSLTNDSTAFETRVGEQIISGNQDQPEGGFDGFLQSILCTDLIGWRSVSRKLLLYITDAGFHFAGDGKLGGAVLPYPYSCRLPDSFGGEPFVAYQDAEMYDYPSVGQIARALREREIIPIFAATSPQMNIYEALAAELGQGAFVGTLDASSSNVVELVETLYNTISQRVLFEQESVPGISVQVTPTDCPAPGVINNGVCENLQIENTAIFSVSVTISECTPELLAGGQRVTVRAIGFGSFDVLVNATCGCDCESMLLPNSSDCSGNGTLVCGVCDCNSGNFGEICQCDALNQRPDIMCPVSTTGQQCSGRGTCTCGICNCQSDFFGPACECDQRDCVNQENGMVCSGRGTCGCDGRCTCNIETVSKMPYIGDMGQCECTPDTMGCRDPSNRTSICNGNGRCGCDGTCECNSPSPYFGQYCELCSGSDICLETNCESNRACANCILDIIAPKTDEILTADFFKDASNLPEGSNITMDNVNNVIQGILPAGTCASMCPSGAIVINGSNSEEYFIEDRTAVPCEEVRGGCSYQYFVAIIDRDFTAVHVAYDRNCPQPRASTAPWIIALGLIGPLLVLGILALIMLKVLLVIIDLIEVQKFERELANTKYSKNENPLYRSAAKDYKNPIYGQ